MSPLFAGNNDDNLSMDKSREDNLFSLHDWLDAFKAKKLALVADPIARNLLSQMLSKDAKMRPSLTRIRAHPFLSG